MTVSYNRHLTLIVLNPVVAIYWHHFASFQLLLVYGFPGEWKVLAGFETRGEPGIRRWQCNHGAQGSHFGSRNFGVKGSSRYNFSRQ